MAHLMHIFSFHFDLNCFLRNSTVFLWQNNEPLKMVPQGERLVTQILDAINTNYKMLLVYFQLPSRFPVASELLHARNY